MKKKLERTNNSKAAGGNPLLTLQHQGISSNTRRLACSHGTWACEQRATGRRENRRDQRHWLLIQFPGDGHGRDRTEGNVSGPCEILRARVLLEAGAPLGTSSLGGWDKLRGLRGTLSSPPPTPPTCRRFGEGGCWNEGPQPSGTLPPAPSLPWACAFPLEGQPPRPPQASHAGHPQRPHFQTQGPWRGRLRAGV